MSSFPLHGLFADIHFAIIIIFPKKARGYAPMKANTDLPLKNEYPHFTPTWNVCGYSNLEIYLILKPIAVQLLVSSLLLNGFYNR